MKQHKDVKLSGGAAHFTTGVSVTLALLTLGIIAMVRIAATVESRRMLEKIEISVILADSIEDRQAMTIRDKIAAQSFALDTRFISRRQAMDNWEAATGEDLEKTFGVNPLSPEVAFTVKSEFTSARGIESIKKKVSAMKGVEEVGTPDGEMIDEMNKTINKLTLTLTSLAVVMFIISFVLINNTVRLSIYSRRFAIHTMQLVGATDGFIRRPFVSSNASVGMIAGLIASAIIAMLLASAPQIGFAEINKLITWQIAAVVCVSLILIGGLICGVAAANATSRHLHQDYEELFR